MFNNGLVCVKTSLVALGLFGGGRGGGGGGLTKNYKEGK